jgi:hypothetical protein
LRHNQSKSKVQLEWFRKFALNHDISHSVTMVNGN